MNTPEDAKLPFKKSFNMCVSCGGYACKRFKSQNQFGIEQILHLCQGCAMRDTIALLRTFTWKERIIILFKGCI
jgi:hypothetical protein